MIEKLEPYFSSRTSIDGIHWEVRPNLEDVINKVNEIIDAVNAVDAEPVRHGHWVGRSESDCTPFCSVCGRTRWGSSLEYVQKFVPYCQYCGAKMDEEVEE